ncbi:MULTISPECIES: hypothetical protein [Stenotrophomonas]|uniref:hypothetical protein n=1 Tax=Stenotrophomonas TaxID=40323 RepID=UPI000B6D6BE9|nr:MULTISPECIES: hypothetical protein [Stenotrophomonas]SMR69229.1 hypothetical protein SAMN04487863_0236 [Stenotrophomonas sp. yr243]SNT58167.1 hypothetical protein SAMN05518671_3677 [Stenotrophomonas lactitubi]
MRVSIFVAALAVAVAGHALADSTQDPTHLYDEVSTQGETMDAFVARISTKAIEVTEERRVSICGVIGQSGNRFGIRVGTSNTWKKCDIDLANTVAGFTSTGITFHTTTSDEGSQRGFSAENFKRPGGYVAFGNVVRYQEGRTKDRIVSSP